MHRNQEHRNKQINKQKKNQPTNRAIQNSLIISKNNTTTTTPTIVTLHRNNLESRIIKGVAKTQTKYLTQKERKKERVNSSC